MIPLIYPKELEIKETRNSIFTHYCLQLPQITPIFIFLPDLVTNETNSIFPEGVPGVE